MPKPEPRTTYKYSDEFKATAVKLSQLPGVAIQDVAESLYIHPFMLSRWRKEAREGRIVTKGVDVNKDVPGRSRAARCCFGKNGSTRCRSVWISRYLWVLRRRPKSIHWRPAVTIAHKVSGPCDGTRTDKGAWLRRIPLRTRESPARISWACIAHVRAGSTYGLP